MHLSKRHPEAFWSVPANNVHLQIGQAVPGCLGGLFSWFELNFPPSQSSLAAMSLQVTFYISYVTKSMTRTSTNYKRLLTSVRNQRRQEEKETE